MAEKFAENLRSARINARKTASQCADSLGCTVAAWSQWESGKREPKYSVLLDICLLLETSPNELLGFPSVSTEGDTTHGANSPIIKVNGSHNTIAPPSTSSSPSTPKKKKAKK